MSYTFDITQEDIPDDDAEAWLALERLRDIEDDSFGDPEGRPGGHFLPLYEQLVARYPCITTPEGENSPWCDGPLLGNFGKKHTILGVVYSRVEDSLPVIIAIATDLGFTVFDPQDERIHRPKGWVPQASVTVPAPTPAVPATPWWQFWRRRPTGR